MDSDGPNYKIRSIDTALADLRNSYNRTPESSRRAREELARMIESLKAEFAVREARRRYEAG